MLRGVNEMSQDTCECRTASLRSSAKFRRSSFVVCRSSQRRSTDDQRRLHLVRGFTLLELMIVLSIIMILMAVAVPMYNQSIIQARESVLRSNLSTLRSVISQYTLDKQKAPQSLDDLVTAGYLRQIPVDPMTRQTNWEVVQEDVMLAVDQQDPGITDVHSASSASASDGSAYSTW
jgi:general secretion pathway protein G